MKKILFLSYNDLGGGAGIAAYKFFYNLKKNKRYKSHFYCIKKYSKNPNVREIKIQFFSYFKILINFIIAKILFLIFPLKNYQKRSLCLFDTGILNNVDLDQYDLVHFHWLFNEMISLKEIVNIKQKLIISTHDLWFINGSSHFNTISKKDGFLRQNSKNF